MENKVYIFNTKNYFTYYPCDNQVRPCVVIAPGGGYDHTSKVEALNVARKFNQNGYHACVLNYREDLSLYPAPQKLLAYTIFEMKRNELNTKIISIGFSAGGHLTLSNAIYHEEYGYDSLPDYLILCYPVISSDKEIAHLGSFNALLGGLEDKTMLDKLSLERHITNDVPPTFIWHSKTDESVSCENSIRLVKEFKDYKVPYEFHLYDVGVHGMSLADDTIPDLRKRNEIVATWFSKCINWLKNQIN